ncbi:MAG TPA: 50S ribosomal protein L18 [Firmicutes bacterium]|jgi:large subunit ribosomal protein L18|nr:50S ribosomal protein L18 [Bacillota bacterium]HAZ21078.1 50S ribosomal protein L18 [Bacillota bacterium]HBE05460.1 50S ribosomal protein L18 [Bacillota bacterium]HBG45125.1 50S ribosomal protein L18 [Bacillota bacterium]HBL49376.1 50S ribosomal protein L18 [Bacillota bacterium]
MITRTDRKASRRKRHLRIRKKVFGTAERPRLAVFRSINHIYAQIIDDQKGTTLATASTLDGDIKGKVGGHGGNIAAAKEVGSAIAKRAQEQGIKSVIFDRGGHIYHGRVSALAEAAREAGLEF